MNLVQQAGLATSTDFARYVVEPHSLLVLISEG